MKYALALGGGGTRGAFQAGVWKALDKLGMETDIITGTSIGAVNGAVFASGGDAEGLWRSVTPEKVVCLPEGESNIFSLSSIGAFIRKGFDGGLDISPFRSLLEQHISEERLRKSPVDFGLCTYSSSEKKPVELFLRDIPNGRLIDYILASACFPMFKPVTINGREYTDGGIRNNIPEDMLIRRGCSDIISVSARGIGIVRDTDRGGINVIDIKPEKADGLMDFDREAISRSIERGYLETLRCFGACMGTEVYIDAQSYLNAVSRYGKPVLNGLESAAVLLGIDMLRLYDFDSLVGEVLRNRTKNEKLNRLIRIIKSKAPGYFRGKLDIFGEYFDAANAVVYFSEKFLGK